MTRYPVHVAVDAALFMLTHFVRHDPGGIVDLWKGSRTCRSANIFPGLAAVAATGDAALFDTNENFVRHARIQHNAPSMRHMRSGWKGPLAIIRQAAKRR